MKKEKSCGAIIFRNDIIPEQVLLIKHKAGGHWSFPKGHVEFFETEEQTAKREIMEETGIIVDLDTQLRLSVTYSPKKETEKEVIYFLAIAKSYNIVTQESEISEGIWVDIAQVSKYLTYNNDKMLIKKALDFYKQKYKLK